MNYEGKTRRVDIIVSVMLLSSPRGRAERGKRRLKEKDKGQEATKG